MDLLLPFIFGFGSIALIIGAFCLFYDSPVFWILVVAGVAYVGIKDWREDREKREAEEGRRLEEKWATEEKPASRSGETERLLREGIESARAQDWKMAIRRLRQAHDTDPMDEVVLYNLALAHDFAGRGYVAICWYEAFLRLASEGEFRKAAIARIDALNAKNRDDLRELVTAVLEISSQQVNGYRWGDLQAVACAQAAFGDVEGALSTLEKLRRIDPGDEYWSGSSLLVADALLNQGIYDVPEQMTQRIDAQSAAFLRQRIQNARDSGPRRETSSVTNRGDRFVVEWWADYADRIPRGTHHEKHAMELFAVDPFFRPQPGPEMDIGAFIEGLRGLPQNAAQDLMDGVKRLYLTHREIQRHSYRHARKEPRHPQGGKAPDLTKMYDRARELEEKFEQAERDGLLLKR